MAAIRPIAVGLPVRGDHVLVLDGHDTVTGTEFHRAIGGGIEFGETAEQAVRREFAEELGVRLGEVRLLGVIENIFEYEGEAGHEIAFVFAVDSAEIDALALDADLQVLDEGSPVRWAPVPLERPLFPEGAAALVESEISRRRGTTGR